MISYQEAIHFLNTIKFSYGPRAHDEIVEILKKLTPDLILKIDLTAMMYYIHKELFRSDANMTTTFGKFLPEGYRVSFPENGLKRMYVITPVLQYWINLYSGQAFILDNKQAKELSSELDMQDLVELSNNMSL